MDVCTNLLTHNPGLTLKYMLHLLWVQMSLFAFGLLFRTTDLYSWLSRDVLENEPKKHNSPSAMFDDVLQQVASPPENVCLVCREDFTRPVRLSCGHIFCDYCIRSALSQSDKCPYCQRMVFQEESKTQVYQTRLALILNVCVFGLYAAIVSLAATGAMFELMNCARGCGTGFGWHEAPCSWKRGKMWPFVSYLFKQYMNGWMS